jgi:hypothetical protein
MADNSNPGDKSAPWYKDELTEITPQAREILEKYSKIAPNEIIRHILRVVSVLAGSLSVLLSVHLLMSLCLWALVNEHCMKDRS